MGRYHREMDYAETREEILQALKTLHKMGFVTRANYLCCGSCASYAIASSLEEKIEKSRANLEIWDALPIVHGVKAKNIKLPLGCIFWNRQSEQGFREDGSIYITYGQIGTSAYGDIGIPTEETGRLLFSALKFRGVHVEWDGKESTCILVKTPDRIYEDNERAYHEIADRMPLPNEIGVERLKEYEEELARNKQYAETKRLDAERKLAMVAEKKLEADMKSPDYIPKHIPADDKKPFCPLVGEDGNAFAVLGRAARALNRAGLHDAAKEMTARAMSGDYNHLLAVVMEYIEENGIERCKHCGGDIDICGGCSEEADEDIEEDA